MSDHEHWNVQINIQHVTEADRPGNALARGMAPKEKVSMDVLKLAVVAGTEVEAYEKAHRMLVANNPETVVVRPEESITLTEALARPDYPTEGTFANPRPVARPVRDNPQA